MRRVVITYVVLVTLLGLASVAMLPAVHADPTQLWSLTFLLLASYVVLGELFPLRVPRGGREGVLTVSTTFAFALLLHLGALEAVVALVVASVASDALHRRSAARTLFNAGQLALSVVAAGVVLEALRPEATAPVGVGEVGMVAIVASAGTFFLVNFLLSGAAVALSTKAPVLALLQQDLLPQAAWMAMLLSLSPIVVAAADASPALLPLFLVPMAALYKSMDLFLQRERQALSDALTALPNRVVFADRTKQAVRRAAWSDEPSAVVIVGLDRFKDVNDRLGRDGGDQVLRKIAARLRRVVPEPDTVARLGGDEFGLVVSPINLQMLEAGVINRLTDAVREAVNVRGVPVNLEASIGVALTPDHGSDPDQLVAYADTAMLRAKRRGTDWELHDPEWFLEAGNRLARLQHLREALDKRHLVLHYQPQVAVATGQVEGFEALVRWEDPERGLIPPDRFIPLVEEDDLIRDLTRYVLSAALETVKDLQGDGLEHRVSVNVSPRDLQDPGLPDEVGALLALSQVDPALLELEVTERTIMARPARAVAVVERLHDLGVRVAVDDFGTGSTSLRLLSHLPADSLKLDRSLVAGLLQSGPESAIVASTIELGHRLDMTVVAEGVETVEMLERLRELGCDSVQGYLYGRPVPAARLRDCLDQVA